MTSPSCKLAARREKDLAFVAALVRHRMIRTSVMTGLIAAVAEAGLRSRLAEAWEVCRRRANGGLPSESGDA